MADNLGAGPAFVPAASSRQGVSTKGFNRGDVVRDFRGHFAEWRCVGGHDACCQMYPSENCPTCEPMCRRCRAEWRNQ